MKGVKNVSETLINSSFQTAASIALAGSPKPFRTRAWGVVQTFHKSAAQTEGASGWRRSGGGLPGEREEGMRRPKAPPAPPTRKPDEVDGASVWSLAVQRGLEHGSVWGGHSHPEARTGWAGLSPGPFPPVWAEVQIRSPALPALQGPAATLLSTVWEVCIDRFS